MKSKFCSVVLTFFSFLVCISVSWSLPIDFDWSNRPVAVRLTASELSGQEKPQFTSAGQPITVTQAADRIVITTYLDKPMLGYDYAIRVLGQEVAIIANGKLIETIPVQGSDGVYNCIPSLYLNPGSNTIDLIRSKSSVPQLEYVEMFALLFTNEDVHFNQVFGEKTISVMAQPPANSEQQKFDVLHYDLSHTVTMTSSIITAQLIMTAKCTTASFDTVVLDLNSNNGSFTVSSVDRGVGTSTLVYSQTTNWLFITMPGTITTNSIFTVRVFYSGIPNPSANLFGNLYSYIQTTHNSGTIPLVCSFSEPFGARKWWPCKDLPDDKATIDSHWICPTAYYPVSNGKLVSVTTSGGNHTFNYTETYPIATYLVSIACTNYAYYYGIYTSQNLLSQMTVGAYIYPENTVSESTGVQGTITMVDFFAKKFGEYPFLTEKYVTATHNYTSSMEHQTATSLRPGGLSPSYFVKDVHELSHQWFGDMITIQTFDHIWLNEGFATYCEALWQEGFYGIDSYHNYVNAWSTSDAYPIVSSNGDALSNSIVYRKGAWVLHMLRHVVGDSTFFAAMRNYAADTALTYGNAVSIDLQHDVEKTVGGSTSLTWFFNEWLYQANRPNYFWGASSHVSSGTTYFDLEIRQTQASATYVMPIDFRITFTPSGSTTVTVWNTQYAKQNYHIPLGPGLTVSTITFDPDNWVLDYNTPEAYAVEVSRFEAD